MIIFISLTLHFTLLHFLVFVGNSSNLIAQQNLLRPHTTVSGSFGSQVRGSTVGIVVVITVGAFVFEELVGTVSVLACICVETVNWSTMLLLLIKFASAVISLT